MIESPSATVRLNRVTRTFKHVTAVCDLDLILQPGCIYGLLGPNGSGKTTTLCTALGLIQPDRGTVELLGAPPNDTSRARVGFVPEQRALPETARVASLLMFIGQMRGFGKAEAKRRASEWIEKFDLGDKANDRIKTLSNGQQQKVQIALSMTCDPDVILMDEPLAALDPEHQALVTHHLREAADRGATVVLSTHRLHEAQTLIDHVIMMYQGNKVLDQSLETAVQEAFDGSWRIRADGDLSWVEGSDIASASKFEGGLDVQLRDGDGVGALLRRASSATGKIWSIEAVLPTLHDLYMAYAARHDSRVAMMVSK
jgi:ABC-2 type transport system ATP-binding protein